MTSEEFRAAVFAEIRNWAAASFPTLPVVYENGPVPDEDKIGPIWLDVEIRWYDGSVAALGSTPRTRDFGAVSLSCFYKVGEGTKSPGQVIDSVSALLQARRFGSAVMGARKRTVPTNLRGWHKTGVLIPFTLG